MQKKVSLGRSGLTYEQMRLRMKRWLIAGLDDADWDPEYRRTKHVGMGGQKFLCDFAEGFSEEECDRIANGG